MCDRRSWREVRAPLGVAGRDDDVAYDRREFGEVPPGGGLFRRVDDMLAVLDAVSLDARAWLVGGWMGSGVALDAPERIAGLVLLAPAVRGDPEPDEEAYITATGGLRGSRLKPSPSVPREKAGSA